MLVENFSVTYRIPGDPALHPLDSLSSVLTIKLL
jgi:hypothetical protein